jgi:hypothetical protein
MTLKLYNNNSLLIDGDESLSIYKSTAGSSLVNTKSMLLDGVDEWVNFGSAINSMTGLTPFSISMRFKLTSLKTQDLFQNYNGTEGILITQDGAGGVTFWMVKTGFLQARIATLFPTGVWQHLLYTSDGSGALAGFKAYLNNVDTSFSVTNDTFTGPMAVTKDLEIGKEYTGDSARYLNANVEEYAVWKNKELTASEVSTVYNGGSAGDLTSLSPDWWVRFGDDPLDDATATTGNVQDQIGTAHGVPQNTDGDEFVLDVP